MFEDERMENRYVEDWLTAQTESDKTIRNYMQNLRAFTVFAENRGKDFSNIVSEWRRVKRAGDNAREDFIDTWTDLVRAFHTRIKRKYAPLTVKNFLATLKSFFRFWDIPVTVRLPRHACVIYHNKDLTKDEIRQILTFASPRDRVIWLVMAESGMRAETAVNLKYWQIKEDFEAERIPMRILLPASSLKDRVGDRWTFIGEDGFRELKQYLTRRLPLNDEDYVFASEKQGRVAGAQFTVASLSVKFARIVRKLGLSKACEGKPGSIRMHGLRKYFRNNIKADSAYIKFWMGHSLGVDAHYISREVEKHRAIYNEGYPYLRLYDIEPIIRREDIERIVEARVEELKKENENLKWAYKQLRDMITGSKNGQPNLFETVNELSEELSKLVKRIEELERENKELRKKSKS